jgi:cytosine deaminase
MDFRTIPQGGVTLSNVTVPACLLGQEGDLVRTDISIAEGRIASPQPIAVDMGGAMVFPAFVDMHTHLDKGHIWPRSPNPDGSFMGALTTVRADSAARWSAEDLRPRMSFSLRCGLCPWHPRDPDASRFHGAAGRHHLASLPGASGGLGRPDRPAGRVPDRLRQVDGRDGSFGHTADLVAETKGGVLGMVTYPMADLRDR